MYGLTRLEHETTRNVGWAVRLQRKRQVFLKYFSDLIYEGKAKSLAAAKAYRDEVCEKNPLMTRKDYAQLKRKNNSSGTPGVFRYKGFGRKGRIVEFWIAFWQGPAGKRKQRKFSVAKFGEETAKALAIQTRERELEKLQQPYMNCHSQKDMLSSETGTLRRT